MPDYYENPGFRKKSNKRKKRRLSRQTLFIIGCVLFICVCSGGYIAFYHFMPSMKTESIFERGYSETEMNIVLNGELLTLQNPPIRFAGRPAVYLPVDFVKAYMDPYIFWEPEANRLTITTENKVIAMKTEDLNYFVNSEPMLLNLPVYREGDMAYIPQDFALSMYHTDFQFYEDTNTLIMRPLNTETVTADTLKKAELRFEPDKKSTVAEKLPVGAKLTVFEEEGTYTKAMTEQGVLGYVTTDKLSEKTVAPGVPKPEETPDYPAKPVIEGKVVLLWDQIWNAGGSSAPEKLAAQPGVNVLSPTWFSFDETGSDIVNIADEAYVQAAHENGAQVWALLADFTKDGTFRTHDILTDAAAREHVIRQLLAFVAMYGLDGINIDFEGVTEADAPYYLQFLRELAPFMKRQGTILSVDMYVPLYTRHYNRAEVAKVIDYLCVMTYDETWSGSPAPGPCASLGFVHDGVAATLSEVPKEKILMGIPLYERVWTEYEAEGAVKFYKEDMTMQAAYNLFSQNGATFEWLPDMGLYYAEFFTVEEGRDVVKKVWYEDERTMAEKLKVAEQYETAGVCLWKRGLERQEVWPAILDYAERNEMQKPEAGGDNNG